jgi:hypothetical protein
MGPATHSYASAPVKASLSRWHDSGIRKLSARRKPYDDPKRSFCEPHVVHIIPFGGDTFECRRLQRAESQQHFPEVGKITMRGLHHGGLHVGVVWTACGEADQQVAQRIGASPVGNLLFNGGRSDRLCRCAAGNSWKLSAAGRPVALILRPENGEIYVSRGSGRS